MKWLWQELGTLAFWLAWPALAIYLHWHRERTRVLIRHDQKIVVLKTWLGTGKWGLPGGGLHAGETPLTGAIREVAEETGLRLEPEQVMPLFAGECRPFGLRFYCHFFTIELDALAGLRPRLGEITSVAWLDAAALNPQNAEQDVLLALHRTGSKAPNSPRP